MSTEMGTLLKTRITNQNSRDYSNNLKIFIGDSTWAATNEKLHNLLVGQYFPKSKVMSLHPFFVEPIGQNPKVFSLQ